jgi:preprotein translocase subunit SecF
MQIIERRSLWFTISVLLMLPGIIYMIWSAVTNGHVLPLGIDYTGGTQWELRFEQPVANSDVRQVIVDAGYSDVSVVSVEDEGSALIKLRTIEMGEKEALAAQLQEAIGPFEERSYRSIGPSIGGEVSRAALWAVMISAVLILLYLTWAFREVAHPLRFGICAVAAPLHVVMVTISFIGIMNWLADWEIDALFLTAILTVIGYSVSDAIVVFDRIRDNFKRHRGESLTMVANRSIVETAPRSLGTQMATLLTLVSILLLGGPTLQKFMATLIVGITCGTYSSIFNATALLVAWEERSLLHRTKNVASSVDGRTALA